MKEIAKKTLILRVLEILEKYSSKEHPVTITYIAKFLNEEDVPCDRRTIGRNIDYLIEYGKNIIKIPGGGCYIDGTKKGKYHIIVNNENGGKKIKHFNAEFVGFDGDKVFKIMIENIGTKSLRFPEDVENGKFSTDDIGLMVLFKDKKRRIKK